MNDFIGRADGIAQLPTDGTTVMAARSCEIVAEDTACPPAYFVLPEVGLFDGRPTLRRP
jgi:hypothetical protein